VVMYSLLSAVVALDATPKVSIRSTPAQSYCTSAFSSHLLSSREMLRNKESC
jgi:hypothetical protein